MAPVLFRLVHVLFTTADWLIWSACVLSFLGLIRDGGWRYHPVVLAVIDAGMALCKPFRRWMERRGIPTRPLDFSPILASVCIRVTEWVLLTLLSLLPG